MESYKPLKSEQIKIESTLCMQCEHLSCLMGRCPLLTGTKEEKNHKKFNGTYIIGIDHGYGNMKTANCSFPTGVLKSDTERSFGRDVLVWNGSYYQIGIGHKAFSAEKMLDEDYYVLTLAAIGRELDREKIYETDVFIAAGLPLTWVGRQKDTFKKYLLQNETVEFTFRRKDYRIRIVGADLYPQGFAAIVNNLANFSGVSMLATSATEP